VEAGDSKPPPGLDRPAEEQWLLQNQQHLRNELQTWLRSVWKRWPQCQEQSPVIIFLDAATDHDDRDATTKDHQDDDEDEILFPVLHETAISRILRQVADYYLLNLSLAVLHVDMAQVLRRLSEVARPEEVMLTTLLWAALQWTVDYCSSSSSTFPADSAMLMKQREEWLQTSRAPPRWLDGTTSLRTISNGWNQQQQKQQKAEDRKDCDSSSRLEESCVLSFVAGIEELQHLLTWENDGWQWVNDGGVLRSAKANAHLSVQVVCVALC
jgi:hypothetical protein